MILFVLSVTRSLLDGILADWSYQFEFIGKQRTRGAGEGSQGMDIDCKEDPKSMSHDHHRQLIQDNCLVALEVVEKVTTKRKAKVFLHLIYMNMPNKFNELLQTLLLIESHITTEQYPISARHILAKLTANLRNVITGDRMLSKHQLPGILFDAQNSDPYCYGTSVDKSAKWISLDVYMENAMDGKNLHHVSAFEVLTEMTKTLQVVYQASWQETFQALWISALRLVQRDPVPWEGPVPCLEPRLCMLLSIVPLAIVSLVKEETEKTYSPTLNGNDANELSSRSQGLIFSLQALGQFPCLLMPPPPAVNAANEAASKAATFLANFRNGDDSLSPVNQDRASIRAVGNMLHLIVEACIERKLVDTSAYFWPGYVVPSASSKDPILVQESPWSSFMEGNSLTDSLKSSLIATPASSTLELEKLYNTALNGDEKEQSAAAKILCGASLTHGWNIQEHVARTVVKLLSLSAPYSSMRIDAGSHLPDYKSMLSAVLFEVLSVDKVHILALNGMVPELVAALVPLCEAFGSIPPLPNAKSSPSDDMPIYAIFSCAFLFLLRLWKFYKPSQEHFIAGRCGPVKLELTLDHVLAMRNRQIAFQTSALGERLDYEPVHIDSFPKLRTWYLQNQACVASTISGLCSKSSTHQVANNIVNMICWKMMKRGNSGNPSCSSGDISNSSINAEEDAYRRLALPAWEILEAIPFVLEAVLSACAHGRLSSRDLTTALRDLVDFLPASFATITSYFSAEITRGTWKPVSMNGVDWPSPAANLILIESEMREMLASAGVHIPSCYASGTAPVLPLPMAALVGLTITFKLEKSLHYIHAIIGQALENCCAACPWSSRPITAALWIQKIYTWHDYIVFGCVCSPFTRDRDVISQLVRSCFSSFLSVHDSKSQMQNLTPHSSVNGLLGALNAGGSPRPIAPGYLFLRTCRSFQDVRYVGNVIFNLVIEWAEKLASGCALGSRAPQLKSGQNSLSAAVVGVRDVASLGASLICITGGEELVLILYEETMPEALFSATVATGRTVSVLKGYAMAYLLITCGAFVWGAGKRSPVLTSMFPSRLKQAFVVHLEFLARVVDGDVVLGCDLLTWKSYVSCFVGLLTLLVPGWVPKVRKETLQKLAYGLRGWNEYNLALHLLMCGGAEMVTSVVESVL